MDVYAWIEGRSWEPIRGLQLHDLGLDQAFLNLSSHLQTPSWIYAQRQPCYKCTHYSLLSKLPAQNSTALKVSSVFDLEMVVLSEDAGTTVDLAEINASLVECSHKMSFGEFGIYDFVVSSIGNQSKCHSETVQPPVDIFLPVLVVTLMSITGLAIIFSGYYLWKFWKRRQAEERRASSDAESNSEFAINRDGNKVKKLKSRLRSLDVFRGFCVVPLLFHCGYLGGYQALEHATWEGLPVAEWPFPWFLWIMGVCIPLKLKNVLAKGISRGRILFEVFQRFVLLFALGLIVNSSEIGVQVETMRIHGVLQRIAFMCLFAGGIFALCWPRNYNEYSGRYSDIQVLMSQWIIHGAIHLLYLCLVFFLPIPGCPTGYLGPGGISEGGKYFNCTGGTAGYVDKLLTGEDHLFQSPTAKAVYQVKVFDPEGPFSNLPSLLTMILGIQAGATLVMHPDWPTRKSRLLTWGFCCILLSLILHMNDFIPINKQLWSTSYALVTAGAAFVCLTLSMYLVDVVQVWKGFPFLAPGINCLLLYIGSRVAANMWPWHFAYGKMDTHFARLIDSCWSVFVWVLVAMYLQYKKIVVTV